MDSRGWKAEQSRGGNMQLWDRFAARVKPVRFPATTVSINTTKTTPYSITTTVNP